MGEVTRKEGVLGRTGGEEGMGVDGGCQGKASADATGPAWDGRGRAGGKGGDVM